MKMRITMLPVASALLLSGVLVVSACGKTPPQSANGEGPVAETAGHAEDGALKLSADEVRRAGIKLEALVAGTVADSLTVTATIQANQDRIARVAPRVEGRIVATHAGLGEQVRAGQALATLDSLAVGEAAAQWAQAQSAHRVAEADFKRAEALSTEEIIPRKEFLRARSEFERANADLRAAEDRLRLLGVAPAAVAERSASTFTINAPFAGVVIEKKAPLGQLATPSEALFVVADLSRVWIEADLTEAVLARVRAGAQASVTVTAYPGEHFSGRVTYVAAVLDKDKRTIPARIEVDNRDGRLKPEMFATATIVANGAAARPAAQALTVPDEAIVLMQGVPTVFVFEHEGYVQRAVEPGDKLNGRTVVKSGLQSGEQVVVAGTYALKARVLKSQISDEH